MNLDITLSEKEKHMLKLEKINLFEKIFELRTKIEHIDRKLKMDTKLKRTQKQKEATRNLIKFNKEKAGKE